MKKHHLTTQGIVADASFLSAKWKLTRCAKPSSAKWAMDDERTVHFAYLIFYKAHSISCILNFNKLQIPSKKV
jgi:hypothetical protein